MDKVVNIEERIEGQKQKKQLERHRGKIEAIQKLIQCTSCHMRCAMCGHHLKDAFAFAFCENCRDEFDDFLSISKGEKPPDVFWHNKEWIDMLSAWLNYRQAVNGFMNSPEFRLLLEELDPES
jgi:transcription elongation factor Elf1